MSEPYRVGDHYGIHVYQGNRPVATFHEADEASWFVEVVNAALEAAEEPQVIPALVDAARRRRVFRQAGERR